MTKDEDDITIGNGHRDYVTKMWVYPNGRHLRRTEIYSVIYHHSLAVFAVCFEVWSWTQNSEKGSCGVLS